MSKQVVPSIDINDNGPVVVVSVVVGFCSVVVVGCVAFKCRERHSFGDMLRIGGLICL